MFTRARIYLGRTADHERVYLDILRQPVAHAVTLIDHTTADRLDRLSISGTVYRAHSSSGCAFGQVLSSARRVVEPAGSLTVLDVTTLCAIWDRWHLSDLRAGCVHQDDTIPLSADIPVRYGMPDVLGWQLANVPPCPRTGYRYGSEWLAEVVPLSVWTTLDRIIARATPDPHASC